MRGLMILENGFEDTEALTTRDVLSRAGVRVLCASIYTLDVESQYNLPVKADLLLENVKTKDFDFLIIPGGRAVRTILDGNVDLDKVILDFDKAHKLIASICAGPSILGRLNILKGKNYTCFPGFESESFLGNLSEDSVVVSENIITAKSMYYSVDFSLAIISYLLGEEKAKNVLTNLKGM